MREIICTIAAANHLPKAACLADSMNRAHPDCQIVLCLVERDRSQALTLLDKFDHVVLASELDIPDFESFIFRHNIYEACCAFKAQLLTWALQKFPDEEYFIYVDPDVRVYSRFHELETMLPYANIIVTPHILQEEVDLGRIRDNIFRVLIAGAFNLGFLAVHRSLDTQKFLNWWNSKLQASCYMDPSHGIFVDQRWVLLALSYCEMKILREPGYNLANWNVSTRVLTKSETGNYYVNGQPLRFCHFSGIDSARDIYYFTKHSPGHSPIFEMRKNYLREVGVLDVDGLSGIPWSYECFKSGEHIASELRHAYRNNLRLRKAIPHPFAESNETLFSVLCDGAA